MNAEIEKPLESTEIAALAKSESVSVDQLELIEANWFSGERIRVFYEEVLKNCNGTHANAVSEIAEKLLNRGNLNAFKMATLLGDIASHAYGIGFSKGLKESFKP